ncbi:hypothetical protein RJ641_007635 [Dillenia turbinata]|uniref:DUF4219 domain-containing protein n=1 Tax=Dillenia turbinata TaxID=194707 RepID=A0AAN8V966_9MAGN
MATDSAFVQAAIPRFDGHYDHWSMLMENFLRSKEYWAVIESGIQEPPTAAVLTETQTAELEARKLKDLKAKNYLFQAIDPASLMPESSTPTAIVNSPPVAEVSEEEAQTFRRILNPGERVADIGNDHSKNSEDNDCEGEIAKASRQVGVNWVFRNRSRRKAEKFADHLMNDLLMNLILVQSRTSSQAVESVFEEVVRAKTSEKQRESERYAPFSAYETGVRNETEDENLRHTVGDEKPRSSLLVIENTPLLSFIDSTKYRKGSVKLV